MNLGITKASTFYRLWARSARWSPRCLTPLLRHPHQTTKVGQRIWVAKPQGRWVDREREYYLRTLSTVLSGTKRRLRTNEKDDYGYDKGHNSRRDHWWRPLAWVGICDDLRQNSRSTKALQNFSPHKALTRDHLDISHLRMLSSVVYVFLNKEERSLKSEKRAAKALKEYLVGYDCHTIYRVHIKEQIKVIIVKDLRIFGDYESKVATDLPDYENGTPMFQEFLLEDNNDKEECLQSREGRKVKRKQAREDQKVNTEEMQPSTRGKSQKVRNAEPILSTTTSTNHKSRSGRTVKLSVKAQEKKDLAHQKHLSHTERILEIEKQKTLSPFERSSEIEM